MIKILIINNKHCQLICDDQEFTNKLKYHLSFRLLGVEYTQAFQNGWSGRTFLLSAKNKFNLGLLQTVKDFFEKNEKEFIVEDMRNKKTIEDPIDLTDKLKLYKFDTRDYQQRIVDITDKYDRGIVRAATGSGKTLVTALITAKINKPTIIYVIGLDLLKQFHDLYSKLFDEKIGYIGNGVCDIQRINIASIWTIGRSLNVDAKKICEDEEFENDEKEASYDQKQKIVNLLEKTKLHILDESHVISCGTMSEIYKVINPEYFYGFSGTPFKDDGSDLLVHSFLGSKIVDVSASELIEKKILAQPIIKFVPIPKIRLSSSNYQSVYKEYVVENENRNGIIIDNIKKLLDKKYTPLVLFKQIKHGKILFDLLKDNNINCEMLNGSDSLIRRGEVKSKIENKEINLILASTIYDIGLDLPILDALVLCGSGKSSIRTLQRIGRVIRKFDGKNQAAIVDFYDQVKFFKQHSCFRKKTYESEKGFRVLKCKDMK